MDNDLKSSEALKAYAREVLCGNNPTNSLLIRMFDEIIDNAPSPWIPITYRPMTVEERIAFAEHYGVEYCDTLEEKAFDCPMPEDGQEILISTSWGVVEDVAATDIDGEGFICYGLDIKGDWDEVDAWMPKPEPYKKEDEENV